MKNDKQMLDMLRNEFEKSSESVNVPLRLQKESIVTMLKNDEQKETDFSFKTGTNKSKLVAIRRLAAAAAMLAIVVVGVLATRADGVKVIRKDTFYSGYEGVEILRSAQSNEEIEIAVKEILGSSADEQQSEPQNGKNPVQTEKGQTIFKDEENAAEPYKGYRSVVTEEIESAKEIGESFYAASNIYSSTDVVSVNNDVDADIVKSNGKYLYILTTDRNPETGNMTEKIKIIGTVSEGEMREISAVTISDNVVAGASEECIEIHLKDNVLIAILGIKDFETESRTTAVYYDISNPESPRKIREHTQDGKYLFSSLNGNGLCLVTDKQIKGADYSVMPTFGVDGDQTELTFEEVFISLKDPEASYIFITVTDIDDFSKPVGRLAILGSGKQIYCSESAITVTREFVSVDSAENASSPVFTEIYRFNINGSSIGFAGCYVVEGSLIGDVCVDSENGYMTVATAVEDSGNICVLDVNMEFVSGIKEIFPQKKADGVKFIGNKCYISSGDETMIVDLTYAKFPKVSGTISSKLFAGSLYEISETKILGINTESDGTPVFRLFDVSDPKNPRVASEYRLDAGSSVLSSADSRSIMVVPEKQIFGVPVVMRNNEKGTEISAYMIFNVSDGNITSAGVCCHDESYVGDAAARAAYADGAVYTVSGKKVVAFAADTCKEIAACEIR